MPLTCASLSAALVPTSRAVVARRVARKLTARTAAAARRPIAMASDAPTYHLLTLQYGAFFHHGHDFQRRTRMRFAFVVFCTEI